MTLDMGNTDKLMLFRREAQRMGVKVIPPSVNASGVDFAVKDGAILYSLAALKNVGAGAIEHLVAVREEGGPFRSIGDFARRIDARMLNKRALESMAKAGAFDGLNPNRAQVLDAVESILSMANRTSSAAEAGQNDLFGGLQGVSDDLVLPRRDAWLPMDKLAQEFEAVGFYLSGHPLDDYMKPLSKLGVDTWAAFHDKALTKGATRRQAGWHRHPPPGAALQVRQQVRLRRLLRSHRTVRGDLLLRYACRLPRSSGARQRGHRAGRGRCRGRGGEAPAAGCRGAGQGGRKCITGLTIFVRDCEAAGLHRPAPDQWRPFARSSRHACMEKGREVEVSLGNKFTVTPQIKGAIKAIAGVVDVQDF